MLSLQWTQRIVGAILTPPDNPCIILKLMHSVIIKAEPYTGSNGTRLRRFVCRFQSLEESSQTASSCVGEWPRFGSDQMDYLEDGVWAVHEEVPVQTTSAA